MGSSEYSVFGVKLVGSAKLGGVGPEDMERKRGWLSIKFTTKSAGQGEVTLFSEDVMELANSLITEMVLEVAKMEVALKHQEATNKVTKEIEGLKWDALNTEEGDDG